MKVLANDGISEIGIKTLEAKKFEVISLNKNCSPCISLEKWNDNESFFNCPYDKSCMKEILPIQVYNTIKKKL